jgi:disulfide bond formation protein DsbB
MYPLVPILAAGIIRAERAVVAYALPLTVIGFLIAAYHNLLYWGIIPERLAPCELGVSCTTKFFEWLGFITIPFMALSGFLVIGTLLVLYSRQSKTDPVQ